MTLWEEFKNEYPTGKGADTDFAWQQWRLLLPDDKQAALDGLRRWKDSAEWENRRYVPNAGNFLAKGKWKETPAEYQEEAKPFNPFEQTKPLSQEELFRKRHITTEASYHMWVRANDPNTYKYRRQAHG